MAGRGGGKERVPGGPEDQEKCGQRQGKFGHVGYARGVGQGSWGGCGCSEGVLAASAVLEVEGQCPWGEGGEGGGGR